jgi:hypothetical protein
LFQPWDESEHRYAAVPIAAHSASLLYIKYKIIPVSIQMRGFHASKQQKDPEIEYTVRRSPEVMNALKESVARS